MNSRLPWQPLSCGGVQAETLPACILGATAALRSQRATESTDRDVAHNPGLQVQLRQLSCQQTARYRPVPAVGGACMAAVIMSAVAIRSRTFSTSSMGLCSRPPHRVEPRGRREQHVVASVRRRHGARQRVRRT
jgi:hypothetical protein